MPRVFSAHDEEVRIPDLGRVGVLFSPRVLHLIAERLLARGGERRAASF